MNKYIVEVWQSVGDMIVEAPTKDEAEKVKKQLEEAGATVEVK